MDSALAYAALATTAGLLLLSGLAETNQPAPIPLFQVPENADRTVVVTGRIVDVEPLAGDAERLILEDDNRSLHLFVRGQTDVVAGDIVSAQGRVARYGGNWELVVEDAEHVQIVAAWSERHVPLRNIVDEPWRFKDTSVLTRGTFEPGSRLPVYLGAQGSSQRLRLVGLEIDSFAAGQVIDAAGTIEYEPDLNGFRLRVSQATPAES